MLGWWKYTERNVEFYQKYGFKYFKTKPTKFHKVQAKDKSERMVHAYIKIAIKVALLKLVWCL